MGEEIFAKEMRREVETSVKLSDWGLREATKGRPSTGSQTSVLGAHAELPWSSLDLSQSEE
ncbi:hypothetical protein ACQPXM_36050 [Kribbella sp. CA-253562]|uniref:hypothetical protein n=1 Tax=Kribbella sp. CA-253562 TaxID=3239942 RepID=UPI003D9178F1